MDKLQSLGFRLNEVARRYTRRFEARAQALSLQLAQCKALVLVAENEGVSQSRLSEISEIDPAHLVAILDRLEADGWAQRRRRYGDRRVWSLAITENAEPVLRLIWNAIGETYDEALQGLSTEEIAAMVMVLERVHSNLTACKPLGVIPLEATADKTTTRRRLKLLRQTPPARNAASTKD
jgi:MarR family transcriptional regulator for hemolysin